MQIVISIDAGGQAVIASSPTPGHPVAGDLGSPQAPAPPPRPPAPAAAQGAFNAGPAPSGPAGGGGPPPFVVADDVAAAATGAGGDASAGSAPGSVQEPPAIEIAGPNGSETSS